MRKNTLAVVISSLLLGAAAAQAEPATDAAAPESQAQTVPATDPTTTSTESSTGSTEASGDAAATQDVDAATQDSGSVTSANPEVGTPRSNVDEHARSGDYYPNSAGTVGDDPAAPHDTAVPMSSVGEGSSGTDRWDAADTDRDTYLSKDELNAVAPTLSAKFGDIDVDGDEKLTRDEFRTWHQSNQAKMDADQGVEPATTEPATSGTPESASQDDVSEDASTTSTAPETDTGE